MGRRSVSAISSATTTRTRNINGIDYQILVEADFLVNIFEGRHDPMKPPKRCARTSSAQRPASSILKDLFL